MSKRKPVDHKISTPKSSKVKKTQQQSSVVEEHDENIDTSSDFISVRSTSSAWSGNNSDIYDRRAVAEPKRRRVLVDKAPIPAGNLLVPKDTSSAQREHVPDTEHLPSRSSTTGDLQRKISSPKRNTNSFIATRSSPGSPLAQLASVAGPSTQQGRPSSRSPTRKDDQRKNSSPKRNANSSIVTRSYPGSPLAQLPNVAGPSTQQGKKSSRSPTRKVDLRRISSPKKNTNSSISTRSSPGSPLHQPPNVAGPSAQQGKPIFRSPTRKDNQRKKSPPKRDTNSSISTRSSVGSQLAQPLNVAGPSTQQGKPSSRSPTRRVVQQRKTPPKRNTNSLVTIRSKNSRVSSQPKKASKSNEVKNKFAFIPRKNSNLSRMDQHIMHLQRTTHFLMSRLSFQRVAREAAVNIVGPSEYKFTALSLAALQEAAEAYLIGLFEDSYLLSLHCSRKTLFVRDMALARRIRGDLNY